MLFDALKNGGRKEMIKRKVKEINNSIVEKFVSFGFEESHTITEENNQIGPVMRRLEYKTDVPSGFIYTTGGIEVIVLQNNYIKINVLFNAPVVREGDQYDKGFEVVIGTKKYTLYTGNILSIQFLNSLLSAINLKTIIEMGPQSYQFIQQCQLCPELDRQIPLSIEDYEKTYWIQRSLKNASMYIDQLSLNRLQKQEFKALLAGLSKYIDPTIFAILTESINIEAECEDNEEIGDVTDENYEEYIEE